MVPATDSANVGTYAFSAYYKMTGYYGFYLPESFNLVVMPAMTTDPRSPNHSLATCTLNAYPFYIGGYTNHIYPYSMRIDSFGNIISTGYAYVPPYAETSSKYAGYISLMDQRGNFYWIYWIALRIGS